MQLIEPLDENTLNAHVGKTIMAVTHDELQYIGRLSGITNGTLYFNESLESKAAAKAKRKKRGTNSKKSGRSQATDSSAMIYAAPFAEINAPAFANKFNLQLDRIAYLFEL